MQGPCQRGGRRDVGQLVRRINAASARAKLQLALELGRLVLDGLYEGDLELWREHRGRDAGFGRLAAHPDLQVSRARLSRAVAILELHDRCPVATSQHLGMSHYQEVLALRPNQQCLLLQRAHDGKWSVRRLRLSARRFRERNKVSRSGRPPKKRYERSLHTLKRLSDDHPDWLFAGIDIESLSRAERVEIQRILFNIHLDVDALLRMLEGWGYREAPRDDEALARWEEVRRTLTETRSNAGVRL